MGIRVLVTGAAAPAGQSLLHALRDNCVTLLACDCDSGPTGMLDDVSPENRFVVHRSDSPEFVGELVTLCVQHEVDVLVPMRESDQVALSRVPQVFERLGARLWLAPIPTHATHSQARRILQLGQRRRSIQLVGDWFRRITGSDLAAS